MRSFATYRLDSSRPRLRSLTAFLTIVLLASFCACGGGTSSGGMITTVAGNGSAGYGGDNGPATSAQLHTAAAVAVDANGNLYIGDVDNHVVRKVATSAGVITTVAGNGTVGSSGDNGPATEAELNSPYGVATDAAGNVYVADSVGRIRKITASLITTIAGGDFICSFADNIPATSATLCSPHGVATDRLGNVYIADSNDQAIRKVSVSTGVIVTVAGNTAQGYDGDNGPATSAKFNYPNAVAVDGSGNLYIADTQNHAVRMVAASNGVITTAAGNGSAGYSGDNGPAPSAQLNFPLGVAVDHLGNLYIADAGNNVIRKVIASTGVIVTVAGNGTPGYSGDGGPATSAQLHNPSGVALDADGNLYIADRVNNVVRKVTQ